MREQSQSRPGRITGRLQAIKGSRTGAATSPTSWGSSGGTEGTMEHHGSDLQLLKLVHESAEPSLAAEIAIKVILDFLGPPRLVQAHTVVAPQAPDGITE